MVQLIKAFYKYKFGEFVCDQATLSKKHAKTLLTYERNNWDKSRKHWIGAALIAFA